MRSSQPESFDVHSELARLLTKKPLDIDLKRDNLSNKLDSENFKKLHTDDIAKKENSDDDKIAEIQNVRKPLNSINANSAINTLNKNDSKSSTQNLHTLKSNKSKRGKDNFYYQKEIKKLKKENKILKRELKVNYKNALKSENTINKYEDILKSVFTPGQIKVLENAKQGTTKWCTEDIVSAISLKSISPRAYQYLRNTMKIPLPCFSTLRKWIQRVELKRV